MLQDISAKELKGHDILALERFQDSTRHMAEFLVKKRGYACGQPGDEVRLFLDDAGYKKLLEDQRQGMVRIRKDAHVVEGHIILKKKRRRH